MTALRATQIAQSLNPTEYAAIQLQLPKKKSILKNFGFVWSNKAKLSDLVDADVSKNTGE